MIDEGINRKLKNIKDKSYGTDSFATNPIPNIKDGSQANIRVRYQTPIPKPKIGIINNITNSMLYGGPVDPIDPKDPTYVKPINQVTRILPDLQTRIHNDTTNRGFAPDFTTDCHPISAIVGLTGVINTLESEIDLIGITDINNTILGVGAVNTGGIQNTFVGVNAGIVNIADQNTFVGYEAGFSNTSGTNNVYIGHKAGVDSDIGSDNTYIGLDTGFLGSDNTLIGFDAGFDNIADGNTFVGSGAGFANTSGDGNTFIGFATGEDNIIGADNTFVGWGAGTNNIADDNTFVGSVAGNTNISGAKNTFVGRSAGFLNSIGVDNTFVGYEAGRDNTADENTFVGSVAGNANTSGGENTFVGYGAGFLNVLGNQNTFVGTLAGRNNIAGQNTFIGFATGFDNTSGNGNTFVGYEAGNLNIIGSDNVFIGNRAGYGETLSDKLYIANTSTTIPLIAGDFSTKAVGINTNNSPNSTLQVGGSIARPVSLIITSGVTLGITQSHVEVDTTSGSRTVILPDATTISGRIYYIQKVVSSNDLVVATTSSQTINSGTTKTIAAGAATQWQTARVASNGLNWIGNLLTAL